MTSIDVTRNQIIMKPCNAFSSMVIQYHCHLSLYYELLLPWITIVLSKIYFFTIDYPIHAKLRIISVYSVYSHIISCRQLESRNTSTAVNSVRPEMGQMRNPANIITNLYHLIEPRYQHDRVAIRSYNHRYLESIYVTTLYFSKHHDYMSYVRLTKQIPRNSGLSDNAACKRRAYLWIFS